VPRSSRRKRDERNLERAMQLILEAHEKGELDEYIADLKKLAGELPDAAAGQSRWQQFAGRAKEEVYEIGTSIIAKFLIGMSKP